MLRSVTSHRATRAATRRFRADVEAQATAHIVALLGHLLPETDTVTPTGPAELHASTTAYWPDNAAVFVSATQTLTITHHGQPRDITVRYSATTEGDEFTDPTPTINASIDTLWATTFGEFEFSGGLRAREFPQDVVASIDDLTPESTEFRVALIDTRTGLTVHAQSFDITGIALSDGALKVVAHQHVLHPDEFIAYCVRRTITEHVGTPGRRRLEPIDETHIEEFNAAAALLRDEVRRHREVTARKIAGPSTAGTGA